MAKRRGHGEGTIHKRQDGRWVASIRLEGHGRRYFYGKTQKEVSEKLYKYKQRPGVRFDVEKQTVEEFLTRWLEEVVKPKYRPRTYTSYRDCVVKYIVPHIGACRLSLLNGEQIHITYTALRKYGLSENTLVLIHATLHRALKQALKWKYVDENAANNVEPPVPVRHEMQVLTPDQARALLNVVTGTETETAIRIALSLGLRIGEVMALHWRDVDLEKQTVRIIGTLQYQSVSHSLEIGPTKGGKGRTLMLSPMLIEALRIHRARQLEDRLFMASAWKDEDLVFPNKHGGKRNPGEIRYRFKKALKAADLPDMRFHDLRHSCASFLIAQGEHPKTISEVLGHANIGITMDLYGHSFPGTQRKAIEGLDRLLG